jgi:hypothetical protein
VQLKAGFSDMLDALFAMFTYPSVTKWTLSLAVTFLSSANLFGCVGSAGANACAAGVQDLKVG